MTGGRLRSNKVWTEPFLVPPLRATVCVKPLVRLPQLEDMAGPGTRDGEGIFTFTVAIAVTIAEPPPKLCLRTCHRIATQDSFVSV